MEAFGYAFVVILIILLVGYLSREKFDEVPMSEPSGFSQSGTSYQMVMPETKMVPEMENVSLLPVDVNKEWGELNPSGVVQDNTMFLNEQYIFGINSTNGINKNPNLQLRKDPIIPPGEAGPWNNSTYIPDLYSGKKYEY